MSSRINRTLQFVFMLGMLVTITAFPIAAHQPPEPAVHQMHQEDITLSEDPASCVADVKGEVLGSTPSGVEGYNLVSARVTFAPGGSLGAHIHPGTLVATVVEGSLGFTLITDAQMDIQRAPDADGNRATDVALPGGEVALEVGDGFVETGMVHSARNLSDGQTVVVISGLIEEGKPLTQCVEQ